MNLNKDGNAIGVIIEADDLLTQLSKQRAAKKKDQQKPVKKKATKKAD